MTLTLRYAARSDRGLIREGNQDAVYAGPRLLAVADGMGGMAAGDVASNLAIAAMAHLDEDEPGDSLVDSLRSAVELANQNLRDAVDANPALEGMGTTLTSMLFSGSKMAMVHVGDSRAYMLRDGEFVQVTKDDTYVQMLVDEGRITTEEASIHPQRSLLIRALQGSDVDPTYSVRQALAGDRYLLCSDGLSGPVSDDSIESALRELKDPDECAERLLQLALRGGGPDNITLIVADVTDEDIIEGRPFVGGAASRNTVATRNPVSTPAARASALSTPRPAAAPEGELAPAAAEADEENDPKHHPGRTVLLLLVVLAVLAGGLWAGWAYTQSRYYVGLTDQNVVAIYRGVPDKIVGLQLSSLYEDEGLPLAALTSCDQELVRQLIPTDSLEQARDTVAKLRSHNLQPTCQEPCPTVLPTPSPSLIGPSVTFSPSPSPSTSGSHPGVVPPKSPGAPSSHPASSPATSPSSPPPSPTPSSSC